MIDLSGNISLSFGAQYKAEDTASYILYRFNKKALTNSAVCAERFAVYLGLKLYCDYIFDGGYNEGLGVLCLEPQAVYVKNGEKLALGANSIVIERSVIDSGNFNLYNYAVMSFISHYLFSIAGRGGKIEDNNQMSFGLESTQSTNNVWVNLNDIFVNLIEDRFDKVVNFTHCLIMPKNKFKVAANQIFTDLGLNRNSQIEDNTLKYILKSLADEFCVPQMFVLVRLVQLNYI